MKYKFITLCLVISLIFFGYTLILALNIKPVAAQMSFGGPILSFQPCNTGFLVFIGPPIGGFYMFTIPPFPPAGFVLGLAIPAPIPCVLGTTPMGAGFPVILFGH